MGLVYKSEDTYPYSKNEELRRARVFYDPFGELTSLAVMVRHYFTRLDGSFVLADAEPAPEGFVVILREGTGFSWLR